MRIPAQPSAVSCRTLLVLTVSLALPGAAPAQSQFRDLLVSQNLPFQVKFSSASALGDVDGDGDLDLLLAHEWVYPGPSQGQDDLLLNRGAGQYVLATAGRMPVDNERSSSVTLGDVDGDGDLDAVIGAVFARERLYLNDGTGTFSDATAARLPSVANRFRPYSWQVVLGDVDGDGDLDLFVAHGNPTGTGSCTLGLDTDRLYLNDGRGTFADVTCSSLPPQVAATRDAAFGDLDGDGDLDLALAVDGLFGGKQNRLVRNDGFGHFTLGLQLPDRIDRSSSLVLVDVEGDGDLDLVVGNRSEQDRLYLNDGTGSFIDATASHLPPDADETIDVVAGDVDGDGDPDLVFGVRDGSNRLVLNDGTGVFAASPGRLPGIRSSTTSLALGDVDGDADLDLVITGGSQTGGPESDTLFFNDGTGFYRDTTVAPLPARPGTIFAAAADDFDGDGDQDLVLGNSPQDLFWANDGTGAFVDESASRLPATTVVSDAIAVGDLDGDGDPDLVMGNRLGGATNGVDRLYLNDGTGVFIDGTNGRLPLDPSDTTSLAVADADGDGDLDVLVGNAGPDALWLNDGQGRFRNAADHLRDDPVATTVDLAVGDFDRDGDLDFIAASYGISRFYANTGGGSFVNDTQRRMPGLFLPTTAVAAGDVDGDGDLDLVLANTITTANTLLLNDGPGRFVRPANDLPPVKDSTEDVALADVDEDGDLDIVFGNSQGNSPIQTRLLLNDGHGVFTDVTAARLPVLGSTTRVALFDVDGDQDLDLAAFGFVGVGGGDRVLANLHRQLDTPYVAALGQSFAFDLFARPGYAPAPHTAVLAVASRLGPPIPVPGWGVFHLDPGMLALTPPLSIPTSTGLATVDVQLPASPALLGTPFFAQAAIVDGSGMPFGLTGSTADVIGH